MSDGSTVTLVRHGETEWSRLGQHTSTTDLPLTDVGRDQARDAGARIAARMVGRPRGSAFALVLSSPRKRALETAALCGLGDHVEVDDDLAEWDYGQYEGLTSAEIDRLQPGWSLWRDGCPGGETPGAVQARAERVIQRCLVAAGDSVLFAHGHILRALGAVWTTTDVRWGQALLLGTAGISRLGWEHGQRAIETWNDAPAREV